jgi:hypothetical protein
VAEPVRSRAFDSFKSTKALSTNAIEKGGTRVIGVCVGKPAPAKK